MPGPVNGVNLPDGAMDWSGGVDSVLVPTIASQSNPNGLQRNQLAWLDNATVRDGGITPRGGFNLLGGVHNSNGIWQGGIIYDPGVVFNPYLLIAISGHIYKVVPGPPVVVTDLSAAFGLFMPANQTELFFFVQAEQFVVIQTGDFLTLPLFWDGNILRRSKGITNTAVPPGSPGINEIPAAGPMDYFMGRIWYGIGRSVNGGDIVDGPSGTLAYGFNDAVLNVTENPLVVGGDGFVVSTQDGNIRSIFHNANINATLGQGNLFVGTRRAVYSLNVPVTRADWIGATNNNQPLMTVVQLVNGPVNDKSIVKVNGDCYYQALEPSIRSLLSSLRYWNQPGNIEISNQINRLLQFNDRSLLRFATGTEFGNRLLESSLPRQTPQGVVHDALAVLDFVPMSTFGGQQIPIWEGMYEPPPIYQLFTGDYGGLQRAFSISQSSSDQSFQLWELTEFQQFDNNQSTSNARIKWYAEFPALTWGDEFQLKQLTCAELWVDRIFGTVVFKMQYRPDGESCWIDWHQWQVCSAESTCEDVHNPVCYPIKPYFESYRQTMTLPKPPTQCETGSRRPSDWGYQFQTRIFVTGFCRIRGLILYADMKDRQLYAANVCGDMFKCPPIPSEKASAPVLVGRNLCYSTGDIPNLATPQSYTIAATEGTPPFVYAVTQGVLPPGFTLAQSGSLTATLTEIPDLLAGNAGNFPIVITVTDAVNRTASAVFNILNMNINHRGANGQLGIPYSYQIVVTGGESPWTFSVVAGLTVPGLTYGSNGLISGIPTQPGNKTCTLQISDGTGCIAQFFFSIQIV